MLPLSKEQQGGQYGGTAVSEGREVGEVLEGVWMWLWRGRILSRGGI